MRYHPFLFSAICKCSYTITEDDTNRPVFSSVPPSDQNQWVHETRATTSSPPSTSSPRGSRGNTTALITRRSYNNSTRSSVQTPSPSKVKRKRPKRRVTIVSTQSRSTDSSVQNSGGGDESDWPNFADEDYIVFCFEEDGEFHVVMEDSSGSQDCYNQSPKIFNQQVEEEWFYFSPRLQSNGIKSSTRFKEERDTEEIDTVKARGRVEEDITYEDDMDGIKHRSEYREEDVNMEDLDEENLDYQGMPMECHSRSSESSGLNSQSDKCEQKRQYETNQPIGFSSPRDFHNNPVSSKDENNITSPNYGRDCLSPDEMVNEEESVYLSSESQHNRSSEEDDQSKNDEDSRRQSAETSELSQSEMGDDSLEEENEEMAILSIKSDQSSQSDSTRSSFEFPVLQCEWIGSPVTWPKSGSVHFRKHKSPRVCFRCCKF